MHFMSLAIKAFMIKGQFPPFKVAPGYKGRDYKGPQAALSKDI